MAAARRSAKIQVEMKVEATQSAKWIRLRGTELTKVTAMLPSDLLPPDKAKEGTKLTVTID